MWLERAGLSPWHGSAVQSREGVLPSLECSWGAGHPGASSCQGMVRGSFFSERIHTLEV